MSGVQFYECEYNFMSGVQFYECEYNFMSVSTIL